MESKQTTIFSFKSTLSALNELCTMNPTLVFNIIIAIHPKEQKKIYFSFSSNGASPADGDKVQKQGLSLPSS